MKTAKERAEELVARLRDPKWITQRLSAEEIIEGVISRAMEDEQERCVDAVKEWTFGQRKREILKIIRGEEKKS